MLRFEEITPGNSSILNQRFLKAEQVGNADEPQNTIKVAKDYKAATPIAIYDNKNLIAFLVYEFLNPEKDSFLIWEFVVHHKYQGKGYGYSIIKQFIDFLIINFQAKRIELAVVPGNIPAKNLYLKLGFIENGKINSDGEQEMEMEIKPAE